MLCSDSARSKSKVVFLESEGARQHMMVSKYLPEVSNSDTYFAPVDKSARRKAHDMASKPTMGCWIKSDRLLLCLMMLLEVLSTTIQQPPPAGIPVTLHLRCRCSKGLPAQFPHRGRYEQSRTKLSLFIVQDYENDNADATAGNDAHTNDDLPAVAQTKQCHCPAGRT
eukprot:scaffold82_cov107-Skeletonema_marinoi.AAC.6